MKKTAAFLSLMLLAFAANGATLFTETFANAIPDTGGNSNPYTGTIPGTQFIVTSGSVDITGVLNGSFYTCPQNPTGNCLDLSGTSYGTIQSIPTFTLFAGNTYTLTFDASLNGYSSGSTPTTTFTVSLGTQTQTETANPNGAFYTLTFNPTANQSGAELTFATVSGPTPYYGALLGDIVLTGSTSGPSSVAPEPGMTGALLASFVGLVAWKRRRPRASV